MVGLTFFHVLYSLNALITIVQQQCLVFLLLVFHNLGLPDRIRSDHGGENIRVWQYYTAVITGSSVHNERVEGLCRDVHRCIASIFTTTFRSLESNEKLDALNEVDLYCLRYVFLPRINIIISLRVSGKLEQSCSLF